MARISAVGGGGDIVLPSWFVKVAAGVFLVFVAISSAALTSWAQVGQNTRDITNHEGRLVKVEEKLSKQDVLIEKIDAAKVQMAELKEALRETNTRLDADRDQRRSAK